MRSAIPILIALVLMVAGGCMEPEETPMGPSSSGVDLPGDPVVISFSGTELVLSTDYWAEDVTSKIMEDSDILTCGFNEASGFLCQPYLRFRTDGNLADAAQEGIELTTSNLNLDLPTQDLVKTTQGDNPDIAAREIMVNLWRLSSMALVEDAEGPLDLATMPGTDAWPIPLAVGDPAVESWEPFRLTSSSQAVALFPDSVAAWIAGGEDVILVIDWEGPDGVGDIGFANIYSRRSVNFNDPLAPSDDSATTTDESETLAKIAVFYDNDNEGTSTNCLEDGMLVSREDPGIDTANNVLLTTGIRNAALLDIQLDGDLMVPLMDPNNLIVKATLSLYTDTLGFFNISARDYKNNLTNSGLPSSEGGLTLDVQYAGADSPVHPDDEDGSFLDHYLAMAETVELGEDTSGSMTYYDVAKDPLVLPIMSWLQQVIEGDIDNDGILLKINGSSERCRQLLYELNPADPSRAPRLDVVYIRRPDFD
ncbi:MAG: hypothetical protein GY835_17485 [bacterium]|nr:hypothetical protein [bacterium]